MQRSRTAKESGVWDVQRKIAIPKLAIDSDASVVIAALEALNGVRHVTAETEKKRISVAYDASQIDYRTIVATLHEVGFPPLNSWWTNFRGRLYQFTDSNARENANTPAPPCCNKPPK